MSRGNSGFKSFRELGLKNRRGRPKNWKERLNYRLDNMLSRTPAYQLLGLLGFSVVIIFFGAILYVLAGGIFRQYPGYAIWHAILKIFDPGTMAVDTVPGLPTNAYSIPIRSVSVFLSAAGIFFLGLLISILTTGTENKLRELRKGKTRVFELDHTVILGWSTKVFTIIQEIIFSNDFGQPEIIVILSELEKEIMEDQIRERFPKLPKWLKIVCRTGISIVPEDLDNLNISRAKAIIIISDETHPEILEYGDARIVKTLLAISNNTYVRKLKKRMPIVAEIEKREVLDVAKLAAKGDVQLVLRPEIISKIMVQTSRQSGLSVIYSELLSFDGNEIYVHDAKNFVGKAFKDTLFGFKGQIPIGLIAKDKNKFLSHKAAINGILVNPPKNTPIENGDELILISETEEFSENLFGRQPSPASGVKPISRDARKPEQLLILGWSREIFHVIREFDKYVISGSEIVIFADLEKEIALNQLNSRIGSLLHCSLSFEQGNRLSRNQLESLNLERYNSIVLLSDLKIGENFESADARAIMSLLLIRDILEKKGNHTCRLVTEIHDPKNQKITQTTKVNDIIISNELLSQILTQVSRQPNILSIYDALFAEEGSEIYLKPISLFKPDLKQTTFRELMSSALVRDEIAIGYKKIMEKDGEEEISLRLNPPDIDLPITISPKDRLIVLAEDEVE